MQAVKVSWETFQQNTPLAPPLFWLYTPFKNIAVRSMKHSRYITVILIVYFAKLKVCEWIGIQCTHMYWYSICTVYTEHNIHIYLHRDGHRMRWLGTFSWSMVNFCNIIWSVHLCPSKYHNVAVQGHTLGTVPTITIHIPILTGR